MAAVVRLRLFSGRPDPEWTIPDAMARDLRQAISAGPVVARSQAGLLPFGRRGRPRIGYDGVTFTVTGLGQKPYRASAFDEWIDDPEVVGGVRVDPGRAIERRLYATAPPDVLASLDAMTFERLIEPGNEMLIAGLNPPDHRDGKCHVGPSVRPEDWTRLRFANNCYNFANDTLNTNEFSAPAMPGFMKQMPESDDTETVKRIFQSEIEKDGLLRCEDDTVPATCPIGAFHYMAVMLLHHPGSSLVRDFHCLRLELDATWWHKSGTQVPRNTDDSGGGPQLIADLTKALFAGNPVLVGVYRAVKNNARIK